MIIILLLGAVELSAQRTVYDRINRRVNFGDTAQIHQVILVDYTKLLGTAEGIEGDSLRFRLRNAGTASSIPTYEVRYLGVFTGRPENTGQYSGDGIPAFTDLTYERTALPFGSKRQLRTIMLLYGVVEFNLDDYFQVGAGVIGPLGILTTQRARYSLTPMIHVGLSNQLAYFPLFQRFPEEGGVVMADLSAMLTVGTSDRFLNVGFGRFFNNDNFGDEAIWLHRAAIGGKIGRKWHLYMEAVVSLNGNFDELELYPTINGAYGSRRHRWQFGVFSVFFDDTSFGPIPLPYVGYALYF